MQTTIVIPARLNSSRLPGKPLELICGTPLIKRVFNCCNLLPVYLYVASDSNEILKHIPLANRLLVEAECNSGTDRVAWAAKLLNLADDAIVINVQGDMPFIDTKLIDEFIKFMQDKQVGTVATPCNNNVQPGFVSVVLNNKQEALYFSRSHIPSQTNLPECNYYQHIGIYGFRVKVLKRILKQKESMLESAEQLEQLRILENCIAPISVMLTTHDPGPEINTPADLAAINRY